MFLEIVAHSFLIRPRSGSYIYFLVPFLTTYHPIRDEKPLSGSATTDREVAAQKIPEGFKFNHHACNVWKETTHALERCSERRHSRPPPPRVGRLGGAKIPEGSS